jgi:hypothetical protein
MRAVPIATSGGRRSSRMKMGEKNVAPPTPEAMAVVATRMEMGSRYQYWRVIRSRE